MSLGIEWWLAQFIVNRGNPAVEPVYAELFPMNCFPPPTE
jgi:hypothetical protein